MKKNVFKSCLLLLPAIFILSCKQEIKQLNYKELHRLQFHFSPPAGWMNDPNGLVYYEGEYHLFYQYYPDSTVWGPMHWGHAVSPDMVHWENLPIALYPDTLGYIFSGSAVIDWKNSSGLQTGKYPPVIAIFTQHSEERLKKGRTDFQNQSIAYSNDKGRTFVKYDHNPVIANPGDRDFRDPKVTWVESLKEWVMVLAVGQKVKFYSSKNLLKWDYLSEFGSDSGAHGGVWECPDLFQLKSGDMTKWILIVNINPGAPNGGSGTQYFIGNFDGKAFINDNPPETTLWLDYGPDNYAGVTWSDIPESDGRRVLLGWMSNWAYAQKTPTVEWRSAMTIPRRLKLRNTSSGLRVSSYPVAELIKLRKTGEDAAAKSDSMIMVSGLNEIILKADLTENSAEEFGLIFSNDRHENLRVGYDAKLNQYYIDRTSSGKTDFSPAFSRIHTAPRLTDNNILKIHLYLDYSSAELFADDGITTMTEIFFPDGHFNRIEFFQKNGKLKNRNLAVYELNPAW